MKIGIFGGAFNPFHNGHLHLMQSYLETLALDKILLIPTAVPPHKTGAFLASGEDRLQMLSLVAKQHPKLLVSDIELKRTGKSYSYDTVCEVQRLYPEAALYLIVGSDQFFSFHEWYRADELLRMVTVCTAARGEGEYRSLVRYREEHGDMQRCIVSNFDVVVLSSTEIRQRIKAGDSITGLVPPAIEAYIKEHGLYV